MVGIAVHACFIGALVKLMRRRGTQIKRVQADPVPSVKVRSARKAARLAVGRKAVQDSMESEPSSSSGSKKNSVGGRAERRSGVRKRVIHGLWRYKVIKARRLGAASRTLAWVLPEELEVHRTLIAQVESVLVRLTVVRAF